MDFKVLGLVDRKFSNKRLASLSPKPSPDHNLNPDPSLKPVSQKYLSAFYPRPQTFGFAYMLPTLPVLVLPTSLIILSILPASAFRYETADPCLPSVL